LPKLELNWNMPKFPIDAPIDRVIRALERLGFQIVRQGNHIAIIRENVDGTRTPLTMPNHRRIKASTLRTILNQTGIARDDFLDAYDES
jgi:predicted RNA binding protein YcfA (HicA-like mRNA interferase family)